MLACCRGNQKSSCLQCLVLPSANQPPLTPEKFSCHSNPLPTAGTAGRASPQTSLLLPVEDRERAPLPLTSLLTGLQVLRRAGEQAREVRAPRSPFFLFCLQPHHRDGDWVSLLLPYALKTADSTTLQTCSATVLRRLAPELLSTMYSTLQLCPWVNRPTYPKSPELHCLLGS